ncbi:MAG TPA: patatin-like phospholipase family protein [Anaerolineales bacterium]|nr:patatin-like phospholipase family protein [Anaerolineales bacterium]
MNITLALGGGGAKGNAHIGVIRRLEKEGIKINAVAGTSFGGIVAVFYAMGYSPDEIEDMFASLDQTQLYGHAPDEGPSLMGLAGATNWLKKVLGKRTFNDLKIPCAVTAGDLKSGREVILRHGSLVDAILATIAVPGIFPARRIGEWELVDGGTLNPVPVEPARSLAPRLPVIAVVLATPLGTPARSWNLPLPKYLPRSVLKRITKLSYAQAMDVFLRSLDMVNRAVTEYRLKVDRPEIIIRPRVAHIAFLDRVDVHEVARLGEEAVEEMLPEIHRLFTWQSRLRRALGAMT